jgi:hypothetical protein
MISGRRLAGFGLRLALWMISVVKLVRLRRYAIFDNILSGLLAKQQ